MSLVFWIRRTQWIASPWNGSAMVLGDWSMSHNFARIKSLQTLLDLSWNYLKSTIIHLDLPDLPIKWLQIPCFAGKTAMSVAFLLKVPGTPWVSVAGSIQPSWKAAAVRLSQGKAFRSVIFATEVKEHNFSLWMFSENCGHFSVVCSNDLWSHFLILWSTSYDLIGKLELSLFSLEVLHLGRSPLGHSFAATSLGDDDSYDSNGKRFQAVLTSACSIHIFFSEGLNVMIGKLTSTIDLASHCWSI